MLREMRELVAAVEKVASSCPRNATGAGEVMADVVMLLAITCSAEKVLVALREPAAALKMVLRVVKRGAAPVSARLLRTVRLAVAVFTRASLVVTREFACTKLAVVKFVLMEYAGARRLPSVPALETTHEVEILELPMGRAVPGG
jgi:hypothetical protein